MEKIAVFVDDAAHAHQVLAPLLASGAADVRWSLVICAPRLTRRIGKWVAHSSREQWRDRWSRALRSQIEPLFGERNGAEREWIVARGPLEALTAQLRLRVGSDLRLLDARRPKLGVTLEAVCDEQSADGTNRWTAPVAVSSGLALMLALSD